MSKKLKPVFNQFDLNSTKVENNRSPVVESFFSTSSDNQLVHYDFTSIENIDSSDVSFLNQQTLLLDKTAKNFYDTVGFIFLNAQIRFVTKGNAYVFSRWYEMLGYSKSTVYQYISRYKILSSLTPELKKSVEELPFKVFNKIASLDDPQKYLEMFSTGKLKTLKDLIEYVSPVNEVGKIEVSKDEFDFSFGLSDINSKLEEKKSKLSKRKLEILQKHINAILKLLED